MMGTSKAQFKKEYGSLEELEKKYGETVRVRDYDGTVHVHIVVRGDSRQVFGGRTWTTAPYPGAIIGSYFDPT